MKAIYRLPALKFFVLRFVSLGVWHTLPCKNVYCEDIPAKIGTFVCVPVNLAYSFRCPCQGHLSEKWFCHVFGLNLIANFEFMQDFLKRFLKLMKFPVIQNDC